MKVSICIPTYNQVKYLKKTLDSILIQSYQDFEVIVSDDSSTIDVSLLVDTYRNKFANRLRFSKNELPLGSPSNWEHAISLAKGDWIKIMHHDEWFCSKDSLLKLVEQTDNGIHSFIFAGIHGKYVKNGEEYSNLPSIELIEKIKKDPFHLILGNFIGPPSCILFPKSEITFDNKLRWLVDIDFYIRLVLDDHLTISYIQELLLENCMDEHNITNQYVGDMEMQLTEYIYLLRKYSKQMSLKQKIWYFKCTFQFLNSFKKQYSLFLFIRLLKKRLYV